ncbi:MAG TPA: EAL domain-containing protein [Gammaproteobacteria bacterium]|nr:EAL domain-containing protein [Gammaproteobacteria bacterium]
MPSFDNNNNENGSSADNLEITQPGLLTPTGDDDAETLRRFLREISPLLVNARPADIEAGIRQILGRAVEWAGAAAGCLMRLQHDGRGFVPLFGHGADGETDIFGPLWAASPDDHPALFKRLRGGKTVAAGARGIAEAGLEPLRGDAAELLLVPLRHIDSLYGVLALARRVARQPPLAAASGWLREAARLLVTQLERRSAMLALGDDPGRIFTVVNAVREGIWMLDAAGTTVFVNPPLAAMLGYSVEEMLGRPVFDFMDEESAANARKKLEHTMRGLGSAYERRYVRKDGTSLWTLISVNPMKNAEGDYVGSLAMVLDIGERKRSEALQEYQHQVLELIAQARPLPDVFEGLAQGIERLITGCRCTLAESDGAGRWRIVRDGGIPPGNQPDSGTTMQLEVRDAVGEALGALTVHGVGEAALTSFERELIESAVRYMRIAIQNERTRATLRENEERYRTLVEHAPDAILVYDAAQDRFVDVNANAVHMYGQPRERLLAMRPLDLVPADPALRARTPVEMAELVRQALDGRIPVFESRHRAASGRIFPVEVRLVRLPGGNGSLIRVSVTDITERYAAERNLRLLATRDQLTMLYNRTLFVERVAHAIRLARRRNTGLAVLFLDLDRFKYVNDNYGHSCGDELLKAVAKSLLRSLRESDTIARFGGDEFTILLEGVTETLDAAKVAEKVREAVAQPFKIADREFRTTPSIGISLFPKDGGTVDELLKAADTAMYRAKELGGNGYQFYTEELNRHVLECLSMENDLRTALERRQFELHFQPRLTIATGTIRSAEALLRWKHPEKGMIPPAEFIPVAEDTGLIVPIGEWVLNEACRHAAAWRALRAERGLPPLGVSVNLSVRQLQHGDFDTQVERALAASGLPPNLLEFEITESMVIRNAERIIAVLERIRALGVRFSVDDFGTGYSSLGYLKRLPVDTVKVDRSFIKDVPGDADDRAITEAIAGITRALRLEVVAEGVETEEQLHFLRAIGYSEAQGYLIARPMAGDEFLRFVGLGAGSGESL